MNCSTQTQILFSPYAGKVNGAVELRGQELVLKMKNVHISWKNIIPILLSFIYLVLCPSCCFSHSSCPATLSQSAFPNSVKLPTKLCLYSTSRYSYL